MTGRGSLDGAQRALLSVLVGFALVTALPREGRAEGVVLAFEWLTLTLSLAFGGPAGAVCFGVAALLAVAAWMIHPAAWVVAIGMLGLGHFVRAFGAKGKTTGRGGRWFLASTLGGPIAFMVVVLVAGGSGASVLRAQLSEAMPRDGQGAAISAAAFLAAWASLWLARGDLPSSRALARVVQVATWAVLGTLSVLRLRWIYSVLRFPTELQWSESPILLNAFKLDLGQPIYGPLADCNSYSYSPLLELVHHAILAPFGAELSLVANRHVNLLWHGLSVLLLTWALGGGGERSRGPTVGLAVTFALVVTSSFLAPNLHPDHLTSVGFCAAMALVAAERRIPRGVFLAGLLIVPAFCTMAKLTGAGVGLGLVFAFLRPFRARELALLAGAALLAASTIPLFDASLGPFSTYAISLQASHEIRWGMFWDAWRAPEGRAYIASLVALAFFAGASRVARGEWSSEQVKQAVDDALRLALLTLGFSVTSLLAYMKTGGRANSLLPMSMGAAAIIARLSLASARPLRSLIAVPAALSLLLAVVHVRDPVGDAERNIAKRRLRSAVELIRRERALGHSVLYYCGTQEWILSGERTVPLDRCQTVGELALGGYTEVGEFYDRLRRGHYQTVILGAQALAWRYSRDADVIREILTEHFRPGPPVPDEGDGRLLVFEYAGPVASLASSPAPGSSE